MLIVKIELHSARTGDTKEIGRLLIDNISQCGNASKRGDYRVRLLRRGKFHPLQSGAVLREGRVTNYPRLTYSVWRLVYRALQSVMDKKHEKVWWQIAQAHR